MHNSLSFYNYIAYLCLLEKGLLNPLIIITSCQVTALICMKQDQYTNAFLKRELNFDHITLYQSDFQGQVAFSTPLSMHEARYPVGLAYLVFTPLNYHGITTNYSGTVAGVVAVSKTILYYNMYNFYLI